MQFHNEKFSSISFHYYLFYTFLDLPASFPEAWGLFESRYELTPVFLSLAEHLLFALGLLNFIFSWQTDINAYLVRAFLEIYIAVISSSCQVSLKIQRKHLNLF